MTFINNHTKFLTKILKSLTISFYQNTYLTEKKLYLYIYNNINKIFMNNHN